MGAERPASPSPDSAAASPALALIGVRKSYGAVSALSPTDLAVRQGELVTLLGPSGSGKSTILGIAAGIITPDAGRVHFRGSDVTDRPPHRRDVGMVFQRYTLFPNKTVAENVAFPLEVRHRPAREIRERIGHFLDLVGLAAQADRYPAQLSGGQAQRVALARALVFEPALLLMDEPLGALDRRLRQALQDEIRRIQQETRVPTLYVTHDQEEAMNLSDRIAIVRDGRIIALGPPRQLYRDPPTLWAAGFLGDVNAMRVTALRRVAADRCLATTEGGLEIGARCRDGAIGEDAAIFVVIRPEDCDVTAAPPAGAASYPGRVIGVSYLGAVQRLRIRLDAGPVVVAAIPGRKGEIEPGASIHCAWSDAAPVLLRDR